MEQYYAVDLLKFLYCSFSLGKIKTRIKLFLTSGVEARPSIGSNRSDRQRVGESFSIFLCVVRRPPKMGEAFIDLHTQMAALAISAFYCIIFWENKEAGCI
jgi:hypothetical protein